MATYKSVEVTSKTPAKHGIETVTVIGTYTVVTNLVAADVIQLVTLPEGAIVQDIILSCSASLASTTSASLGDSGASARYIAATTIGQGAATLNRLTVPGGHGYQTTSTITVDLTAVTMTTPVTGAVIKCSVQYVMA